MFAMRVNSAFCISGRGMVLAGRIENGNVWTGSRVLLRTPKISIIKVLAGLERNREVVSHASAGEDVGMLIRDMDPSSLVGGLELIKTEHDPPTWRVIDLIVENEPKRWWEFWK